MTLDFNTFYRETSQKRYDLFVSYLRNGGDCFTLADSEGCLNLTIGSERVLPVWPDENMAQEWAKGEYEGFAPLAINNEAFVEAWLSGMSNDNISVGVAPNLAGESIVLQAAELKNDIQG